MPDTPPDILLVEDDPDHAMLTREGFRMANVPARITVVENGVEAMAYLRRQGSYAEVKRPDMVLLDLNLPKMDGREVLGEIKKDPELRVIPVLILTTSSSPDDVGAAYRLQANSYLLKPFDFFKSVDLIRSIYDFWFRRATPCHEKNSDERDRFTVIPA